MSVRALFCLAEEPSSSQHEGSLLREREEAFVATDKRATEIQHCRELVTSSVAEARVEQECL